MTKHGFMALLAASLMVAAATARTWTDVQGRTIEADIVRATDDGVTVQLRGREVDIPLAKLSVEDREFTKDWRQRKGAVAPADGTTAPAGSLTLLGTDLKTGGAVNTVEQPLAEDVTKKYSKADAQPAKLKVAVALPDGFDPAKPQRVMWVSAAINNEEERTRGNLGAIGIYAKTGVDAGWVVVAADTDLGNPRLEDNQRSEGGDLAVHLAAVELLGNAWPGFKSWQFAVCGHSGGAKASFYRAGDLLQAELKVIGAYLSGCNQDETENACEETRCRKSGFRKVKVWISNGKEDKISTVAHAEALEKSIKANRYGEVRLELWDGGHAMNNDEFRKAMEWFAAAEE